MTDLWVSQTAPFSLLLERPWQRGNLVSIDEREEGTYLIFKDRETKLPRFELLAVPHESPDASVNLNQYRTFAFFKEMETDAPKNSKERLDSSAFSILGRRKNIRRGRGQCTSEDGSGPNLTEEQDFHRGEGEKTPINRYKSSGEAPERLVGPRVTPLRLSAMALSRPVVEPMLLRDNSQGPFGPREEIQYLRRQQTRPPPMPVVSLNATGPIAAIEDLIARQWTDWEQRRPLQVRPTFSVSPNAEYFGRRELANGQVVHQSLAINVLHVFPADESGVPYTLACHEFTVHLAAPTNPSNIWRLECPYPTEGRLQEAVANMVPRGIDLGFDLAFPTHATSTAPDMLPLMERLRLNQTSNEEDAAVETLYGQQDTSVNPRDTVVRSPLAAATGRRTSGYSTEMHDRRAIALATENESWFGSDGGSMPELCSEPESVDLGLCPFCLGGVHATVFDCPLYVPRLSDNEVVAVHALNSLASGGNIVTIWIKFNVDVYLLGDFPAFSELSPEMRRALDNTRGPLQTEWVAPVALRPQETTAAIREILEKFTTEYDEERAREMASEEALAKELEEGLLQARNTATDRTRADTPFPHIPAAVASTHDRTNEPSHTALLDPPVFHRRGRVVDRELWSSSSPSQSGSSTSSDSYENINSATFLHPTTAHERIPTLSPGGWSPAVTEWSVETPDFMFNPTWVIDEAVARALNAEAAAPPTTASTASSTNTTTSSNGDDEPGLHAPFHHLPQFTFQPGNPEDLQLALYFWLYDGALKQLDARCFEDDFGSEPAEKALRILHGPLHRFIDYTAMAAEGVHNLQDAAPHRPYPLSPISERDAPSDDSWSHVRSPTSLDFSLPTYAPTHPAHSITTSALPPLVAFSGYVPIENNHSAEPLESSSESEGGGEAVQIGEGIDSTRTGVGIDLRRLPDGVSSPAVDRKRKNPEGDADGEFQQGRRQRTFAAAARAVAAATPEDIRKSVGDYGIDETSFPDKYLLHHPLLHDLEAAKIQTLWTVLQRQGRERLANNLHELLSIQIRNDIADTHLFDAAHLDECYPEQDARYWDLLREPHVTPTTRAEFATRMGFSDSDSDDSDDDEMHLEYPDSEYRSTDEEGEAPVRQWIHAAPNYYPRGPPYVTRSGALVAGRGGIPHSL
ncbi:hypothetical protein K438DRAFT_1971425 [Mycena galopus ATCC 62051]|nr:hypothetical protein K438DRAFT_1971425 [Mycena galopus ATCC 62051]